MRNYKSIFMRTVSDVGKSPLRSTRARPRMSMHPILMGFVGIGLIAIGGCGDAASTKAPPITGPPHKKWAQLTQDEKIKVVESQPVPNKAELIELIKEGKK